jgi:hypothetical protein
MRVVPMYVYAMLAMQQAAANGMGSTPLLDYYTAAVAKGTRLNNALALAKSPCQVGLLALSRLLSPSVCVAAYPSTWSLEAVDFRSRVLRKSIDRSIEWLTQSINRCTHRPPASSVGSVIKGSLTRRGEAPA